MIFYTSGMHIDVQQLPTLLYLRNLQEKTEKKKNSNKNRSKKTKEEKELRGVKC